MLYDSSPAPSPHIDHAATKAGVHAGSSRLAPRGHPTYALAARKSNAISRDFIGNFLAPILYDDCARHNSARQPQSLRRAIDMDEKQFFYVMAGVVLISLAIVVSFT